MTRLSFEHLLVIYLITVVVRAMQVITNDDQFFFPLVVTQVTHMTLSLIINIYATSIVALKAWCARVHRVFRKHFVDRGLIENTTCAYIQETPQIADGKRDRCPSP
jgi:hypothetical protein